MNFNNVLKTNFLLSFFLFSLSAFTQNVDMKQSKANESKDFQSYPWNLKNTPEYIDLVKSGITIHLNKPILSSPYYWNFLNDKSSANALKAQFLKNRVVRHLRNFLKNYKNSAKISPPNPLLSIDGVNGLIFDIKAKKSFFRISVKENSVLEIQKNIKNNFKDGNKYSLSGVPAYFDRPTQESKDSLNKFFKTYKEDLEELFSKQRNPFFSFYKVNINPDHFTGERAFKLNFPHSNPIKFNGGYLEVNTDTFNDDDLKSLQNYVRVIQSIDSTLLSTIFITSTPKDDLAKFDSEYKNDRIDLIINALEQIQNHAILLKEFKAQKIHLVTCKEHSELECGGVKNEKGKKVVNWPLAIKITKTVFHKHEKVDQNIIDSLINKIEGNN